LMLRRARRHGYGLLALGEQVSYDKAKLKSKRNYTGKLS